MSRFTALLLTLLLVLAAPAGVSAAPSVNGARPVRGDLDEAQVDKSAAAPAPQVVPDHVLVSFRDPGVAASRATAHGLALGASIGAGKGAAAMVETKGRPVDQVLAELKADPAVAWAEPDYVVQLANEGTVQAVSVNDPKTGDQYSLDRMRVRDAWSVSKGGTRLVAVVDTGIQFSHPDLQGRWAVNPGESGGGKESNGRDDDGNGFVDDYRGWDFVNNDNNPNDDNVHGTWVSGIINAIQNNGIGVAGISWTDKVLPVKVMDNTGHGMTSNLALGIDYAVKRGAKIINLSVGGFPYSSTVKAAIDRAWESGAVIVAAAGNFRTSEPSYPAAYPNVISVSGTQADDEFSNWSNYGSTVDVSAPGTLVMTTNCNPCNAWGDYAAISGTSFASPNTAAVVALIWGRYPSYSNQQVVDRLLGTVDDLGYTGYDNRYGRGRVNAARAVGMSVTRVTQSQGDALESNNVSAAAKPIALNTTTRPNIYPAGDADVFKLTAPRAGRIDVAVGYILDSSRPAKAALSVDPVLELLQPDGTLIKKVDDPTNSWVTERASVQLAAGQSVLLRVDNWLPNGNPGAYPVTTAFVDNVAPLVTGRSPVPNATGVAFDGSVRVDFSEAVTGVSGSTVSLVGPAGAVAASVSYSGTRATLRPSAPLAGETAYTVKIGSGIKDLGGNALATSSWSFTTGKALPRLAGSDRYATAASISRWRFAPGVPVVYVATGADFPDALAAGPAAAAGNGPLLLTAPTALPSPTTTELARLKPGRIVVVGSAASVSDGVLSALRGYTTGSVTRIGGRDRYATAALISAATFAPGVPVAYVATGKNFPDALSGGAAAAMGRAPVLLTDGSRLSSAAATELARLKPGRIVVLGDARSISDAVVTQLRSLTTGSVSRLAGGDRYATAAAVSAATYDAGEPSTVLVATGVLFPDGLAADPVAGLIGAPLLLTLPTALPASIADELVRLDPATVVLLGDGNAVSDAVRQQIAGLW